MVALVHDNAKIPDIELSSIFLGPGKCHKLGYKKKKSVFLPPPYTTCTEKISRGLQIMLDEYSGTDYAYSRYHCINVCIQEYM